MAAANTPNQHVLPGTFQGGDTIQKVHDELKKAEIISTVIDDFQPIYLVEANWSPSNYASLGNTMKPDDLQNAPSITLSQPSSSSEAVLKPERTYTLVMTDPDAPSRDNFKWSEYCHWIATGVSAPGPASSSNGEISVALTSLKDIMPYYPPAPPAKTGKHRYVFLVFVPTNGTSETLNLTKPADRPRWGYDKARSSVRTWAKENSLRPIAANFFYAKNKKQ